MTRSYVRHDSTTCMTWLIEMCDTTHPIFGTVVRSFQPSLPVLELRHMTCGSWSVSDLSFTLFHYNYNALQHAATHCNTPQYTFQTSPHCIYNTLQHTATHCNTLQHTATHCITLHHTAVHSIILRHTAKHISTHRNTF